MGNNTGNEESKTLKMFTATHRILETVELETILTKCVFINTLTRLPHVCTLWKNVIANNPYLQHHLFFTPWDDHDYLHLHDIINPFLRYLAFKEGEDKGRLGCNYDFGPAAKISEDEDTDDDGD